MSIKCEIWITHNAEHEKMQLPVNPESLDIKNGSKNSTIDLAGLGEVVILQSRPALRISFSSFFPANEFPGIRVKNLKNPLTLVNKINKWKDSGKPVHLVVTSCGIDLYTSIEDFTYSEVGGDPGTFQYSLDLKEYREVKVRQVVVDIPTETATVEQTEQRVDNTVQPRTYTVQPGDYLIKISKKVYGNSEGWTKIYEANKAIIGGNPNLIYAGQVYTIPD